MNVEKTETKIRQKHLQGHDLLREEVETLFHHIDVLNGNIFDAVWLALEQRKYPGHCLNDKAIDYFKANCPTVETIGDF